MPNGEKPPTTKLSSSLCGGLLSGGDSSSFRGKVYHSTIVAITGISLYRELENETVREIAEKLEAFDIQDGILRDDYGYISPQEFQALKESFRYHADLGCSLYADW